MVFFGLSLAGEAFAVLVQEVLVDLDHDLVAAGDGFALSKNFIDFLFLIIGVDELVASFDRVQFLDSADIEICAWCFGIILGLYLGVILRLVDLDAFRFSVENLLRRKLGFHLKFFYRLKLLRLLNLLHNLNSKLLLPLLIRSDRAHLRNKRRRGHTRRLNSPYFPIDGIQVLPHLSHLLTHSVHSLALLHPLLLQQSLQLIHSSLVHRSLHRALSL